MDQEAPREKMMQEDVADREPLLRLLDKARQAALLLLNMCVCVRELLSCWLSCEPIRFPTSLSMGSPAILKEAKRNSVCPPLRQES